MDQRTVTHGTFSLKRTYPVAPAKVFAAFADPAKKAKWFAGPEEWVLAERKSDFRVGGKETIAGGPKTGPMHVFNAVYHDIVPDVRIIYSYDMHLDQTRISVSLAVIEMKAQDAGTQLTFTEYGAFLDGFDNPKVREEGTDELLNALGRALPTLQRAKMPKLRVHAFSISLDSYGAGPAQDFANPLGVGGMALHNWVFETRMFKTMVGTEGGTTGVDNDFAEAGFAGIGAWILGRNMFGPIRGPWPDDDWKGWWGINPPYHTPVFVLTHYPRAPIAMEGGTTFHFVTGGIHAALERAMEAAEGQDVRLGGGVATLRQYLSARLVDDMHLAVSPMLLGSGEPLFAGLDLSALGYECATYLGTSNAAHYRVTRR